MEGSHNNNFGAYIRSFTRLNDKVVVYGKAFYENTYATDMWGSMMVNTPELKPFDLAETTDENAGSKRFEYFNISGAVGWNIVKQLSIGTKIDFTAGSYAKFRDLRHTNTLMNLDTRVNAFWSLGGYNGIGGALIYKRRTETIKFETFGTTDKVFKTLVEYANGFGEIETFGGEGFTDSNHETPLYDQYLGAGIEGGLGNLYGRIDYSHRTGYYGRKSQYTACYSEHSGDNFHWCVRYVLPEQSRYLCMFEISQISELLTTCRTNYRRETLDGNSSVSYYEYYDPTKIADKARQQGDLSFTGYWKPKGEIFLWYVKASIGYVYGKQTAYIFPYIYTEKMKCIIPKVSWRRSFLFKDTSLLSLEIDYVMQLNYSSQIRGAMKVEYEIPIKKTSAIRPNLALGYEYNRGICEGLKGLYRNYFKAEVGVNF